MNISSTQAVLSSCSYRANFKSEALNLNCNTNNLQGKHPVLVISVGQPYHEEDKFLSTIELINRSDFDNCHVVLADTLQRHNFYKHMNQQDAFNYARQKGDEWLERNLQRLARFNIPYTILRWEQFLDHPDYLRQKNLLLDRYLQDPSYQKIIHTAVEAYLERIDAVQDRKFAFTHGVEYILEECAIAMLLWPTIIRYDFIIYPKPMTISMSKTREIFVETIMNNKCQWLPLRFRKRKTANFIESEK